MTDIVERLRYEAKTARENHPETFCVSEDTADDAADEIERLRDALRKIANGYSDEDGMRNIARQALKEKE